MINSPSSKPVRASVTLTESNILQFVERCQEMLPPEHSHLALDFKSLTHLDLSRPLRGTTFGIIHILLQNPLHEMLSSSPPNFDEINEEKVQAGMIYLYGSSCENHLDDGIPWTFQSKMNLKLIFFDSEKKVYKVKNSKNDVGDIVMRRQSWSVSDGSGWHRIEYKIFQDEVVYKQNVDGTVTSSYKRTLNKFPILVHYFMKKNELYNYTNPRKRQKIVHSLDNNNEENLDFTIPTYQSFNIPSPPEGDSLFFNSFYNDSTGINFFNEQNSHYHISIITSAPDYGFCLESTKVIVVITPPTINNVHYSCIFNGVELTMSRVSDNVYEFFTPYQNSASIVQWNIMSKTINDNDGHDVITNYSKPNIFYYLPSDSKGYISLAYSLSQPFQNEFVMSKFKYIIREMDLSNNNLSKIDFLKEFVHLQSLTLDNNNITENTEFPHLFSLTNLSINSNSVVEIEKFCDNLVVSCPKIRFLSMLGNEACPVFNPLPHHYYNFRIYVISRIALLQLLDSQAVTDEERKHASFIIDKDLPPPFHLENDF